MNRDQKAAAIAEIAANIEESQAVFAVDYRGITVPQVAELRAKLRDADASFRVVKNSLTERAADQTGTEELKPLLAGPTALTFVRGDAALAAKAIADYARLTQLLPFKGGILDGAAVDADQIRAISRLPSREVLYGQLVGVVASPISGLVRTLSALVSGLAVALGQVREKKESGELPAGEPPAAAAPVEDAAADVAPAAETSAEETPAADTPAAAAAADETPSATAAPTEETPAAEAAAEEASAESSAEEPAAPAPAREEEPVAPDTDNQAAPADEPAQDDNQADASAEAETAEANPKED
ncbi:MAG TPA: 50S ribosomal protein L10 [Solirubrobacteraceae bacterium]|jgi:large subunit ribosomal protein L10